MTVSRENLSLSKKYLAFILLFILNQVDSVVINPPWSEDVQTFNGTTFSLVYNPVLSWTGAVRACAERGLKLAKIETREELSFLMNVMMNPKGLMNAWLGATRLNNSQNLYTWLNDGTPVASDLWSKGQPDNLGGKEAYVHIWRQYNGINDGQEYNQLPFICSETRSPSPCS